MEDDGGERKEYICTRCADALIELQHDKEEYLRRYGDKGEMKD